MLRKSTDGLLQFHRQRVRHLRDICDQITQVNHEKVLPDAFGNYILEQARLQDQHGNRIALMVAESTVLIGGLLALQTDESIARVGYGLVEQSRYVIDSVGVG